MVLSHKKITTHKPHKCWGCTKEFPKGTAMWRCVNRDGTLITTYWCEPCQAIIDRMAKDDPRTVQDGFMRGELLEYHEKESHEH